MMEVKRLLDFDSSGFQFLQQQNVLVHDNSQSAFSKQKKSNIRSKSQIKHDIVGWEFIPKVTSKGNLSDSVQEDSQKTTKRESVFASKI